jgi:hypothetical protein
MNPYVTDWGNDCTFQDYGFRYYVIHNCNPQSPLPPQAGVEQPNNPNIYWVPGETVCVWTVAINYSQWSPTAFTYFIAPSVPTFSNQGFVGATKCGGVTASGSARFTNTNNPVDYSINMTSPANNFGAGQNYLKEGRLIMVPYTVASGGYMDATYMESVAQQYTAFRVTGLDTSTPQWSAVNSGSSPYWGSSVTSGNLTNAAGTATLMNIGTETYVTPVDSKTRQLNYRLRFEDTIAASTYTVYFMGTAVDPNNGQTYSTSPFPGTFYYTLLGYWVVDTVPPVSDVIGPYYPNPAARQFYYFSYGWADNYSGVTGVQGYCQSTIADYDPFYAYNLGYWIVPPKTPIPPYPTPTNCSINSGTPGWNYYYTPVTPNADHLNVALSVVDYACNETTDTVLALDPDPWVLTAGGNASATGGFTGFAPRSASLTGLVPGLGDDSYISTYLSISGNTTHVASRRSKLSMVALNYTDDSLKPDGLFATASWYAALSQVAQNNSSATTSTINSIPGSVTTALGGSGGICGNKVVNPSLESSPVFPSNVCASTYNGLTSTYVTGWHRAYTGNPTGQYADYNDNRCPMYAGLTLPASEGLRSESGWIGPAASEYFQGSLVAPLVVGKTYTVAFDLRAVDITPIGGTSQVGTSVIVGADFTTTLRDTPGDYGIHLSSLGQLVQFQATVLSNSFVRISATFTANVAANYFTVGNFVGMGGSAAYSAIDNFSVVEQNDPLCSSPSSVTTQVVEITPAGGELVIGTPAAGGATCDKDYAIFVNGNLRIHPNLTSANGAKCLYVVSGNITIGSGAYRSPTAVPNAGYDTIEGFFITDGQFITSSDLPVGQTIADGLLIIGGLNAGTVALGRILQDTQSSVQPAEVFKYDPAYLTRFRSLLGVEEFSIREF